MWPYQEMHCDLCEKSNRGDVDMCLNLPFLRSPIHVRITLQRLLTGSEEAMQCPLTAFFNLIFADIRTATTCIAHGYRAFVALPYLLECVACGRLLLANRSMSGKHPRLRPIAA